MKDFLSITLLLLSLLILPSSQNSRQKPVLKFDEEGNFKIVQFTDLHFRHNSYRSDSALAMVTHIIMTERPDLVVFTGDIVISKETCSAWNSVIKTMSKTEVPWAAVFGNHDIEYEMTGKQITDMLENTPNSLTSNGPVNLSGNGNYTLKIRSSVSSKTSAVIYLFDSHSAFPTGGKGKWDYIKHDQIEWYRDQSKRFAKANNGVPIPALAFFHIPLPEYKEIEKTAVGMHTETITPSEINSGLYSAMYESKDVMGVFTGHNHNNNFIGCLRNICLGFGIVSGRESYGNIGRGARVIELFEGERRFETWIIKWYDCDIKKDTWEPVKERVRLYYVAYPDSFLGKEETGEEYIEFRNK